MTQPRKSTLPDITWLTVDEVARYFCVKRTAVYRWIKSGKLPALQVSREFRIDEEDVKRLIVPVTPDPAS